MRRKRLLLWLGVTLGPLMLVFGGLQLRARYQLSVIEAMEAELRAAGEPVSQADLYVVDLVPADGANDLLEAHAELRRLAPESMGWHDEFVGPWNADCVDPYWETATEEELNKTRRFLDGLGPVWAAVERAAGREFCTVGGTRGTDGQPDYRQYRTWTPVRDAFETHARLGVSAERVLDTIATGLRLSQSMQRGSRGWVGGIHASTTGFTMSSILRDRVDDGTVDAAIALSHLDRLLDADFADLFHDAVRDNRASSLDLATGRASPGPVRVYLFRKPTPLESLQDSLTRVLTPRGTSLAALRASVEFENEVLARGTPRSGPELDDLIRRHASLAESLGEDPSSSARMAGILLRADTAMRITRVGLAVRRHREEAGSWPSGLADPGLGLDAERRRDLLGGGELLYERTATGVRIASSRYDHDEDKFAEKGLAWELSDR